MFLRRTVLVILIDVRLFLFPPIFWVKSHRVLESLLFSQKTQLTNDCPGSLCSLGFQLWQSPPTGLREDFAPALPPSKLWRLTWTWTWTWTAQVLSATPEALPRLLLNLFQGFYDVQGEKKARTGNSRPMLSKIPAGFISHPALLKNETKETKLNINLFQHTHFNQKTIAKQDY